MNTEKGKETERLWYPILPHKKHTHTYVRWIKLVYLTSINIRQARAKGTECAGWSVQNGGHPISLVSAEKTPIFYMLSSDTFIKDSVGIYFLVKTPSLKQTIRYYCISLCIWERYIQSFKYMIWINLVWNW